MKGKNCKLIISLALAATMFLSIGSGVFAGGTSASDVPRAVAEDRTDNMLSSESKIYPDPEDDLSTKRAFGNGESSKRAASDKERSKENGTDAQPKPYTVDSSAKSPEEYTYQIVPLLSPFNEYFLVKTANPDPTSFRFADKSSVYSDDSTIVRDYDSYRDYPYPDVIYENEETRRVNGGYIFKSFDTDGGTVTLQKVTGYDYWGDPSSFEDTSIKVTLPNLVDEVDYLVNTYANGSSFFDKMDAVESGLNSICLYSGSFIRGEVYKSSDYWKLGFGWKDQLFYILSPFSRRDNKSLFASMIYPFRHDSLGFPSVMGSVSQRLDSSSSYKWNSDNHYLVDVTYNGVTRSYGGAGNGDGQGLSVDKLTKFYKFDGSDNITLAGSKQLLDSYSAIQMTDDIPRDEELTYRQICDTVGEKGAWVNISNHYSYLYKKDNNYYFNAEEWGVGNSIYWGGSLQLVADTWIDGRYVDSHVYVPGEHFSDHPQSNIMLLQVKKPHADYDYDWVYDSSTQSYKKAYKNVSVTENTENVIYYYLEDKNTWETSDYYTFAALVEQGLVDAKYLDQLQLTYNEVLQLHVDKNTDSNPEQGYLYNGASAPGTKFDKLEILTQPTNKTVKLGDSVTFSLKAKGIGLTYQWYYKKTGGKTFSAWNGRTHASETCVPNASCNGMQAYCIIKDSEGKTVQSDTITFTVTQELKITTQPTDKTVKNGSNVTVSLQAEGIGLTYQWYYKKANQTSFRAWTGHTHASETATTDASWNGIILCCKVKDSTGKAVNSNKIKVLLSDEVTIVTHPNDVTAKTGDNVSFTVSAIGVGLTYQWQYRKAGVTSWSNWNGHTTATTTATNNATWNGMQVRCIVKNSEGTTKTSDTAKITLSDVLAITTQPVSKTVKQGEKVTLSLVAQGKELTYQWYYKKAGQTSFSIWNGHTTASTSATTNSTWNGIQFYCIVKDSSGKRVQSNTVKVLFSDVISIITQPSNVTANAGKTVKFTVAAEGVRLTYQWQYKKASDTSWNTWNGHTTASTSATSNDTWDYMQVRCIIKNSSGKTATSNAAKLTLSDVLAITQQPSNVTTQAGKSVTFTVKAKGVGLTYQWYYKKSNATTWSKWGTRTNASTTAKAGDSWNGMKVRCIVKDSKGKTVTSSAATVTLK